MAARDGSIAESVPSAVPENPRAPVQQRLHDGFRTDRRYLSRMVVEAQNERSTRVEAVLELKQDLDASSAKIAAQSSAIRARAQAERAELARTHQGLLDQGKNPYEVARRKVVQREARKERSKIERNIQDREAKLLARLEVEKGLQRRREKLEAENRAYERKYQREMGRAAQEERTNAYLLSRTGKEALDPTGKLVRVYPSQDTTIKDNSFGLGRSAVISPDHRRRVVAKMLFKPTHAGTKPSAMLLPRGQKRHSHQEPEDQEVSALGSSRTEGGDHDDAELKISDRLIMPPLPAVKPGQDLRKVNHALLPNSDLKLPPITGNNSHILHDLRQENEENQVSEDASKSTSSPLKLKKGRNRSVLEERHLTKARQRQKDSRFAQPQIVWGKTFTGNAFLANPPTLWFKDFDVGRPLPLGFTLTNVSSAFNQFRLLPMDDEVIELFDIVYEKPGRMSAGMSCSLRMIFTGTEERDLDTALSVAAPTGVFQIPVRCTCKKAVPVLDTRDVCFAEVVAGERTSVTLTLANEGALPLEYWLRRVQQPESVAQTPIRIESSIPTKNSFEKSQGTAEDGDSEGIGQPEEVRDDIRFGENPQEDNSNQVASQATNEVDEVEPAQQQSLKSRVSSRGSSAESTRTSATFANMTENITLEAENDGNSDTRDPLNPEEQALIEQVCEDIQLKTAKADEPVRFTKHGIVEPYSSSPVVFTFAPATAMKLENERYALEFSGISSPGISSPDLRRLASIPVLVSGTASQVPIFVARSKLDFRCCAYGKLYRHQLVVCNRGKVALKIQVQVPKALVGYVEFNPAFGYVQAAVALQAGSFPVQVKFRPEESMWKRVERAGYGSRTLGMLAVPVSVVVPDQTLPVFFLLTAKLTPVTLQLDLSLDITTGSTDGGLHFGACCVGHGVSHELKITNSARVPQRIGVTSLPKDVTIADISSGVGFVLLPSEVRTLKVVYEPSFPGSLNATGPMGRTKPAITLWSSTFNQTYVLPCSGSGVASDLVFSHSAVRLGATSLGQTQTCNILLTNKSDRHTQLIELRLPPAAAPFLRVTPLVARLTPLETIRLEIDFEPTEDIFKLTKSRYLETKLSNDAALKNHEATVITPSTSARSAEANRSLDQVEEPLSNRESQDSEAFLRTMIPDVSDEPRSCHHTWTILCFQHHQVNTNGKPSTKTKAAVPLQALEVRTTAVEPLVIPSSTTLDFGQVAIGQTLVHELVLQMAPSAADSVSLRAQPLHVLGAFRVIGALREIPSRDKGLIRVEFEPRTPLTYEDELELSAMGMNICIRLRGEGINPSLTLTPPDGSIDFQDVLARTRNVRELVLTNGSAFPLAFSILPLDDFDDNKEGNSVAIAPNPKDVDSLTTSTGLPAFTFSPTSAIIPENGSMNLQVVFQPDHQRPGHYARRYRIKVPNESENHIISLSGRCWENQLYVFAPEADHSVRSALSSDHTSVDAGITTKKEPLLAPRPVEDLFDLPPSISLTQLPPTIGVTELPAAGLRKPSPSVVLTFAENESIHSSRGSFAGDNGNNDTTDSSKRITKTLFIGSTTPSSGVYGGLEEVTFVGAGGSAGSFELVVDAASPYAKLFTLEPARGAIAAGQQLAIQVTYYPPTPTTENALGSETTTPASSARSTGAVMSVSSARANSAQRRPELEVVQWVHVQVQCTLKGGSLWRAIPATGGIPAASVAGGTGTTGNHSQQKGANAGAGTIEGADTRTVVIVLRARLET